MNLNENYVIFLDFQGPLCSYEEHKDFYQMILDKKRKYKAKNKYYCYSELCFKNSRSKIDKKIKSKFLKLTFPLISADLIFKETINELKTLRKAKILASSSTCSYFSDFYHKEVVDLLESLRNKNIKVLKTVPKRKLKQYDIDFLFKETTNKNADEKQIKEKFNRLKKSSYYHYVFSIPALVSIKDLFLTLKNQNKLKMNEEKFLSCCYYLAILRKESGLNFIGAISTIGDGDIRIASAIKWLEENNKEQQLTPVFVDDLIVESGSLIKKFKDNYKGIYLGDLRTKIKVKDIISH